MCGCEFRVGRCVLSRNIIAKWIQRLSLSQKGYHINNAVLGICFLFLPHSLWLLGLQINSTCPSSLTSDIQSLHHLGYCDWTMYVWYTWYHNNLNVILIYLWSSNDWNVLQLWGGFYNWSFNGWITHTWVSGMIFFPS